MRVSAFLLLGLLAALLVLVDAGRDFYKILDVPRDAPKSQIKRHYKKLSRVYHPDKNPGDKDAEQKFMELSSAYEVLADDEKRQIYDRYGEEGLNQQGGGGGSHNPFDIFSHFFGGGFGRPGGASPQERKGPDMVLDLDVTLEDLYNGASIDLDVSKQVVCDHCHGSGARRSEDIQTCQTCQGRGVTVTRVQLGPGMVQQFQQTCDRCGGKGKTVKAVCPMCRGQKVRRGNEQYVIEVEKGMHDGQSTVLEQESDEYPDAIPGDIIFNIATSSHPVFQRNGDNLYTIQHITLLEALVGFSKTLTHLDGREIKLTREGITQYGYVQTIENEGMPHHENPTQFGDLFVEYKVIFPTHIDAKTVDMLKEGAHFPENLQVQHHEL